MIFKLELSPQNFHYDVLYPLYSDLDDKFKKIIQFGKNSRTNMPFHKKVHSPFTTLSYL